MFKEGIIPEETELEVRSYTIEQFDKIFSALNVKLSKKEILRIIPKLNYAKKIWEAEEFFLKKPMPSMNKMRRDDYKTYTKISKHANNLIILIEGNKHKLMCAIAPLEDRLNQKKIISGKLNTLIANLEQLSNELKRPIKLSSGEMAQSISEKKGRPTETYREQFILSLAQIYRKVTKTPPKKVYRNIYTQKFSNPFFRFAEACITPIEKMSNIGLAKAINKVLSKYPEYTK